MFISVSGPPCSGKTTLATSLGLHDPQAHVVGDQPRNALELLAGADLAAFDPVEFQHYVGVNQMLVETRARLEATRVILDKSIIDAIAYWDVLVGRPRPDWASRIANGRYAVLLCNYREIDAIPSGVSVSHYALRPQLDAAIRRVAQEYGFPIYEVRGGVLERLSVALALVARLSRAP